MNILKIIKVLLGIIWFLYCFIGITTNFTHYDFADWIVVITILLCPFIIYYAITKRRTSSIPREAQHPSPRSDLHIKPTIKLHHPQIASTSKVDTETSVKSHPKCNCDGCPKQENCKYGHVISDEFEGKLSLFDKYMLLNSFEKFEDVYDSQEKIATNEELHNLKLLLKLDKQCLINTKTFLEAQKQWLLSQGKCGRSYFYFMNMHKEIQLVDEAIKNYDFYNRDKN